MCFVSFLKTQMEQISATLTNSFVECLTYYKSFENDKFSSLINFIDCLLFIKTGCTLEAVCFYMTMKTFFLCASRCFGWLDCGNRDKFSAAPSLWGIVKLRPLFLAFFPAMLRSAVDWMHLSTILIIDCYKCSKPAALRACRDIFITIIGRLWSSSFPKKNVQW